MAGFRMYLHPDQQIYSVSVKRKGAREHWAWLSYNSYAPREVNFYVSRLGDWNSLYGSALFSYYSEETRNSGTAVVFLKSKNTQPSTPPQTAIAQAEIISAGKP